MELNDLIIVSTDDHVSEPPDMFEQHLSKEHLDKAPKYIENADGTTNWVWESEGIKFPNVGLNAVVGRPKDEFGMEPASHEDLREGCYDVHKRIEDMNAAGVVGSMCFPGFVAFDGGNFLKAKDKKNALRVLRAYNDWHIDSWCGAYPGRFIPLAMMPFWDMDATVAEIKRVYEKGCRTFSMPDNPTVKGLPSIHNEYWEPMWKICHEMGVTISSHIGSGYQPPHASMETPIDAWIITMPISIANAAGDWLHLSALSRYTNLRISFSEGSIGWVPYFMERADFTHQQHHAWTHANFKNRLPSDVFKEHFITCFIDDKFGLKNLDSMNEDMVTYEMDYPHSDCVWPLVPETLMESFDGLSDQQIDKITHLNAMKLWHYDPFSVLGRENCTVSALRAQAEHVDTAPKSKGGNRPTDEGVTRPVTSGDVVTLFKVDGEAS